MNLFPRTTIVLVTALEVLFLKNVVASHRGGINNHHEQRTLHQLTKTIKNSQFYNQQQRELQPLKFSEQINDECLKMEQEMNAKCTCTQSGGNSFRITCAHNDGICENGNANEMCACSFVTVHVSGSSGYFNMEHCLNFMKDGNFNSDVVEPDFCTQITESTCDIAVKGTECNNCGVTIGGNKCTTCEVCDLDKEEDNIKATTGDEEFKLGTSNFEDYIHNNFFSFNGLQETKGVSVDCDNIDSKHSTNGTCIIPDVEWTRPYDHFMETPNVCQAFAEQSGGTEVRNISVGSWMTLLTTTMVFFSGSLLSYMM